MARLATLRDTHLSRDEIVAMTLHQFDTRTTEPTIRSLAAELKVTPTAIYHHFGSQAELFQEVVAQVWEQAFLRLFEMVPDPFAADPVDVLVAVGLATRRTWLAHHRVARYLAATPEANSVINDAVGIMAGLCERLGLEGEDAAAAFHSYASFMVGAVLFAADRKAANEQLTRVLGTEWRPEHAGQGSPTRLALDTVMTLSLTDPARDEELFAQGLRRMAMSFQPTITP